MNFLYSTSVEMGVKVVKMNLRDGMMLSWCPLKSYVTNYSDYCRVHGNQIVEHSSDNKTVLGSSRKLRGTISGTISFKILHV